MTTINVISDLHLVFKPNFYPENLKPADVLVVAGDLSTYPHYEEHTEYIKKSTEGMFKQYIFIKGNHDWYHNTIDDYPNKLNSRERNYKVSFEHIDFICSTLWTPVLDHPYEWSLKYEIHDYDYIKNFKPKTCQSIFNYDLEWIGSNVTYSKMCGRTPVVVTHHVPLQSLLHPRYIGKPINCAFCNTNYAAQIRVMNCAVPVWIHGHSHDHLNVMMDNTRYVRNPFGTVCDAPSSIGFKYDCIVEI